MPLQVGASCYSNAVDAGGAACSLFKPVTSIDFNGTVRTVSCIQADQVTGALVLDVASTSINGTSTHATVEQLQSFPQCNAPDYVAAAEQVAGALLAAWAITYGVWQIYKLLHWSRGDKNA